MDDVPYMNATPDHDTIRFMRDGDSLLLQQGDNTIRMSKTTCNYLATSGFTRILERYRLLTPAALQELRSNKQV